MAKVEVRNTYKSKWLRSDVTHEAYRGYLIRWTIFTLDKPDSRYWIEKDAHFIAWANTLDQAKETIEMLTKG